MTDLLTRSSPIAVARSGMAPLTNMTLCMQTLVDCTEVGDGSPRFGLFYGDSGFGKTVAAAFAAARSGAAYVEAKSLWTVRALLEAIAEELGIVRLERTAPRLLRQIIDELNRAPRPLILDETDYLVKKQMVDVIRDIHDATRIGILLIGEEALPSKLKEWERFDNRILVATPAQPASIDDALLLRDHYGFKDLIADDLTMYLAERCHGVTRRIVINLRGAAREAATAGLDKVDRAWWGRRPVLDGEVATRRSFGA